MLSSVLQTNKRLWQEVQIYNHERSPGDRPPGDEQESYTTQTHPPSTVVNGLAVVLVSRPQRHAKHTRLPNLVTQTTAQVVDIAREVLTALPEAIVLLSLCLLLHYIDVMQILSLGSKRRRPEVRAKTKRPPTRSAAPSASQRSLFERVPTPGRVPYH